MDALGAFLLAMAEDDGGDAEFIAAGAAPDGYTTYNLPEGQLAAVQPGHLMLVMTYGGAPVVGSGEDWVRFALTGTSCGVYAKVLATADRAAPIPMNAGGAWAVYRGPVGLSKRSEIVSTGDPSVPGFTKSAECAGLLFAGLNGGGLTAPSIGGIGTPRDAWASVGDGAGGVRIRLGDILPASAYTDGASIPTIGGAGGGTAIAAIFEFLNG